MPGRQGARPGNRLPGRGSPEEDPGEPCQGGRRRQDQRQELRSAVSLPGGATLTRRPASARSLVPPVSSEREWLREAASVSSSPHVIALGCPCLARGRIARGPSPAEPGAPGKGALAGIA